ncbi:MAG: hypothetical protein ACYC6X_00505 [Minisyncoccota bacterium]
MVSFDTTIDILNTLLCEEEPRTFSPSWIIARAPATYRYIHRHVRTENGDIDWDAVTVELGRSFQKRWTRRHRTRKGLPKPYRGKKEVEAVKRKHGPKLYTFIVALEAEDRVARDRISIALVRLAQKGNLTAREELAELIGFTIQNWIERYWYFSRWRYHPKALRAQVEGCVRRYRFSGSFVNYLFKTLVCSARGLPPVKVFSLDRPIWDDAETTLAERLVQDAETGEIRMYDRSCHNDAAH